MNSHTLIKVGLTLKINLYPVELELFYEFNDFERILFF